MQGVKPKRLPLAIFNKRVHYDSLDWPAKSAAIIPFFKDDLSLAKLVFDKTIELQAIDFYFQNFNINGNAKRLFTHIGAGIGDLLAFSSLAWYLRDYPLQVHSRADHPVIYKWFKRQDIRVMPYYAPIATEFTSVNRAYKYKGLHRLAIEGAAIEYHDKDWYLAHFARIGLNEVPEGYGRPMLRTDRISNKPSAIPMGTDSILICHRASCQMRSSNLEDFYRPIVAAYPDSDIYVHEVNLTQSDWEFVDSIEGQINVIPKSSLENFFLDLYDAALVVSTDSSPIHFREGIEKPAIGVFGAMLKNSRTLDYKFTHSFDVKSDCQFQPCIIHETEAIRHCTNANHGDRVAKCQIGVKFQDQLYNELIKYRDELSGKN
jgi:hypothetical protein